MCEYRLLVHHFSDIFLADLKRVDGTKKGRDSDESEDDRPKKKSGGKPNGKTKGKR